MGDVGGFYRTASGERVRIRRFGNKGYSVLRENGVREHHHTHGNLHNTVVFQKNGDHVVYHRRDGKVIKRVEFKRDSRHGKVSYGKKKNDPDMIMIADEDIGGYARNNAPFNTFGDEDIGGYARNNAPFNTFADENIGGYARNNAPFNTYGDENFEGVGGFYRTANGERVVIHRNGNNHVVFRENGVREHHHKHGNAHNTVVFQKNGDRVHTHRLGGKVIKRVVFKRKL